MKPAARDQDIPRGAGIGAPRRARRREEPTEPGERQGERDSPRSTAATPLLASPVPRPQAPAPTPPVPASLRRLHGRPRPPPAEARAANAARGGCRARASLCCLRPRPPRPPACCPPPSLPSFPPSRARGRALLRQRCGCGCAALGPAPCPSPPATTRTHPRTLLGNQRPRPLLHFGCAHWTEEPRVRSPFVLRLVSFAVRVNQGRMLLGKLGEGGGPRPEEAGLLGGLTKRREGKEGAPGSTDLGSLGKCLKWVVERSPRLQASVTCKGTWSPLSWHTLFAHVRLCRIRNLRPTALAACFGSGSGVDAPRTRVLGRPETHGRRRRWRLSRAGGSGRRWGCGCCWRPRCRWCLRSGQSFPRSPAGSWASPAICFAAPVTFSDSSTFSSWTPTVEGAVRKKHSLKPRSCMQELSSRSADESWGGSRKSKLSSGVISPNYSEDYKSSMFVARTLCSSFWTTTGTLLKN